jgi:membrane-bound lytic murein transglycosylase D
MSAFSKARLLLLVGLLGCVMTGGAAANEPPQAQPMQLAMSPQLADDAGTHYPPLPLSLTLPVQAIEEDAPLPPLIDLTVAPDELWQRMRNGFGMADLQNPLVADRQSWYLNRPEMLQRIFERGRRYLYHIVEELEKRGMPTELALLPMVESAFNPQAVSSARAMGIWQFIPATGRNYKLDQNWWVDERRDIIASTDAALNYLQTIYEMHGDWHLALASYNWGENAVARAMAKNEAKGLPTDYSSLTMPAETRYYVPKLQALKNIVAQPELFGIRLPRVANQPYFDTVVKPQRMDVAVAARLAEIPIEEFVSLNPAYHRPVMNSNQAGPLVLPANKVGTFLANLERYEAQDIPLTNWQTYQLKRGDSLDKVAARHGIDTARLKQINGITPRLKVGPGFNLLVPRPGSQANPELIARALPKLAPEKAPAVKNTRGGKPAKGKAPVAAKAKTPPKAAPKKAAAKPQPKKKR